MGSQLILYYQQAENKVEDCKHEYDDISKLVKAELDRFDKEKVEDFKISIEMFLESIIKTQKEVLPLKQFQSAPRPLFVNRALLPFS